MCFLVDHGEVSPSLVKSSNYSLKIRIFQQQIGYAKYANRSLFPFFFSLSSHQITESSSKTQSSQPHSTPPYGQSGPRTRQTRVTPSSQTLTAREAASRALNGLCFPRFSARSKPRLIRYRALLVVIMRRGLILRTSVKGLRRRFIYFFTT